jgi:hypothetical protein
MKDNPAFEKLRIEIIFTFVIRYSSVPVNLPGKTRIRAGSMSHSPEYIEGRDIQVEASSQ